MTKAEFINTLRSRLTHLPAHEAEQSIAYYSEAIDDRMEDGMSEEAAVASLGSIDDIVRSITVDTPLPVLVKGKVSEARSKHSLSPAAKLLLVCLIIFGAPFWIAAVITAVCVALAVAIAVGACAIGAFAVFLALLCSGIALIAAGAVSFAANAATGLGMIGVGLIISGLALLSFFPIKFLCSFLLVKLPGFFIRTVKTLFDRRPI